MMGVLCTFRPLMILKLGCWKNLNWLKCPRATTHLNWWSKSVWHLVQVYLGFENLSS